MNKAVKKSIFGVIAAVIMFGGLLVPVTVSAQTPARHGYAALGDSVAAGQGLVAVTSPKGDDARCARSSRAYAYTVASKMNLPLTHIACSGATAGDLVTKQAVNGPNITAQLDSAFAAGTPRLITITAGANDVHWNDFIRGCYSTDCSNQASSDLAFFLRGILRLKLHAAFASIYLRSAGSPPPVVITGYYNPLSAACSKYQNQITPQEITWLNGQTDALNQTIKSVASQYSFVSFAPVSFTGHDLCAAKPWVQGIADPAPFHPTATGERVIAGSVLRTLGR